MILKFKITVANRLRVSMLFLFVTICLLNPVVGYSSSLNKPEESTDSITIKQKDTGSIFGSGTSLDNSHFTWGVDIGSSIDLTGHDLSTFDVDAILGYKNKFMNIAGLGVGIHRSVQSGNNFIPVYALLRTSFRDRPSLFFMNLRFGYSFNTINNSPYFGDFSYAAGLGINLSVSSKVKTYFILSFGARHFNKRHQEMLENIDTQYIWITQLQFGINF